MKTIHQLAWEQNAQTRYPELSKEEAIKAYKAEISKRNTGNPGNKNPHLKNNPDKAKELGRLGAEKRWAKVRAEKEK